MHSYIFIYLYNYTIICTSRMVDLIYLCLETLEKNRVSVLPQISSQISGAGHCERLEKTESGDLESPLSGTRRFLVGLSLGGDHWNRNVV